MKEVITTKTDNRDIIQGRSTVEWQHYQKNNKNQITPENSLQQPLFFHRAIIIISRELAHLRNLV